MLYLIEATIASGHGAKTFAEMSAAAFSLPDPASMGITSRTVYLSLDGRTTYLIVETDRPGSILERFASLAPWVDAKVTPVLTAEEAGPAMAAATQRILAGGGDRG